jgi:hypothetical protein
MPDVTCPHCGEPIDTWPDLGGGERQEYIEDCSVCCRPIRFVAVYDERDQDFHVDAFDDP